MFFYKFLLSLILFLSFDIFKNNKLNAAGKLLITADGTYVNNTDRTADYGIEGNGSPSIDVTNTATLTATNFDGMFSCCGGTVTFNNSGTITAIRNGIGQFGGTSDFTNSGTITVTGSTNGQGIGFYNYGNGTITNSGTASGREGIKHASGSLAITNSGTLTGSVVDINNDATVTSLTNSQGGSNILTFDGKLPTNYYIVISSTTNFGKISFANESSAMTFNIDSSSTLTNGTYSSVISSLASSSLVGTTGTSGAKTWTLSETSSGSGIWNLVITTTGGGRSSYTTRVTGKLSNILQVLENINTNSSNTTLTSALDNLSDGALEKAASQINGVTVKRIMGVSAKKHSTFKRAMNKVTSLGSSSVTKTSSQNTSISNFTKNNYGTLSLSDLKNEGFYNLNQNSYTEINSFSEFDFKSLANIYKNKDLFSFSRNNADFFVRTFAEVSNQNKIGNDIGYNADTGGILFGKKIKLNEKKEQGWALGFSLNSIDFDENYGKNDSQTIHASLYQVEDFENYSASINLGTFLTRGDLDRKVTEGTPQTLNSKNFDFGFDATATLSKNLNLKNNWTISPSVSFNTTYVIQDDINESGGDLALDVKTKNLLILKPEIGFDLNRDFINNDIRTRQFNFSLYGSLEDKVDGTTSSATIKDTGSNYNIVDNNSDDKFISLGVGYTDVDKKNNSEQKFSLFRTENEHGNLNSTLLSYTYKKNF